MVRTEGAFDQASSDLEAPFLLSIWGCSRRLLRGLLRVETKQFTQSSQSCFSLFGSRRSGMKSEQNWLCWAVIRYFTIPHDTLQDLMSMSLLRLLPTLARRQRSRSLFFVRTLSTWLTAGSWYADMFVGAWQSGQGQRDMMRQGHNTTEVGLEWSVSWLQKRIFYLHFFDFFIKDLARSQIP